MMGVQEAPARLFYDFDLDAHVPANHILRQIDRFLDVYIVHAQLKPFYSHSPCVREVVRCSTFLYFSGGRDRTMTWDIHRNARPLC